MTSVLYARREGRFAKAALISRCVLAVNVIAYVAGCGDEDVVLRVKCNTANGAVAATFSSVNSGDVVVGSFNERRDELGTIFRVVPGGANSNGARWSPSYRLGTLTKSESHATYWVSKAVHAGLEMDVDSDPERIDQSLRSEIESKLTSGTLIIVMGVHRQTIANVLHAINSDPTALYVLRTAAEQDRYFVVSSIVHADNALIAYGDAGPVVADQAFRLENTFFHVYYSCPPLAPFSLQALLTSRRVPTLYLYTAIRYDDRTKRAQLDQREIALSSIGFIS